MSVDPQPDPAFEEDLVHVFARAAEGVVTETEPLLSGSLARGRTRRRRRAAVIAASVTTLAVVGAGGVVAASLGSPVTTSNALNAAKKGAPPHLDRSVNLLLIGLDSRKDQDGNDLPPQFVQDELHAGSSSDIGGYNADTLIVLHVPADGGKVTAVSIPRDDYVQTYGADGRMHKIKEAYGIAKSAAEAKLAGKGLSKAQLEQQSREAGRSATLQTVQTFLGIPIDHFAEFNLLGFYDIAKAVGPLQVCLHHPVDDPIIPRVTAKDGTALKEGGGTDLELPAGISTLDPAQALSFVRQRHNLPNGDLDRTHRQQAVIASILYRLKQDGTFSDPGGVHSLLDAVKKDLVIDDQWNLLDFAQQAGNLTGGNTEFNTLPISGFKTIEGEDVNTVDQELIRRTVQQTFGPGPASAAPSAVAPSATAPEPPAQGPAVEAGGIPCVN